MFSPEQIKELLKNKNVDKCSFTSITYNKAFKLQAVKKYYQEGLSPNMIFKEAGFNLNIIGRKKAKDCLVRWRRIYNKQGNKALIRENRGGHRQRVRAKIKYKDDKDKIKYLETKLAYLEEENKLLKKMKKLEKP